MDFRSWEGIFYQRVVRVPRNGRKYDCHVQLGEVLHTHVRGPRSQWKIFITLALKKMKVVLMLKKGGGGGKCYLKINVPSRCYLFLHSSFQSGLNELYWEAFGLLKDYEGDSGAGMLFNFKYSLKIVEQQLPALCHTISPWAEKGNSVSTGISADPGSDQGKVSNESTANCTPTLHGLSPASLCTSKQTRSGTQCNSAAIHCSSKKEMAGSGSLPQAAPVLHFREFPPKPPICLGQVSGIHSLSSWGTAGHCHPLLYWCNPIKVHAASPRRCTFLLQHPSAGPSFLHRPSSQGLSKASVLGSHFKEAVVNNPSYGETGFKGGLRVLHLRAFRLGLSSPHPQCEGEQMQIR